MSRMNTFIKTALLALCTVGVATTATADKHSNTVYIYQQGYFPTEIFVDSGDWVQYVNKSYDWRFMEIPVYQSGSSGSPTTTDFWISHNSIQYVQVFPNSGQRFKYDSPTSSSSADEHHGFITYGSAPSQ